MNLFLHTCCAPCLSGSRITFEEEGYQITAFWYNPNISPYMEHLKRLQTFQRYLYLDPLESIEEAGYANLSFNRNVLRNVFGDKPVCDAQFMNDDERKIRCRTCYEMRIENTARRGKEEGFEAFSTTLLLSKHQDHDMIRSVCMDMSKNNDIEFIYKDLRKNWKESIKISREMDLYRQPYCGCIFSENERYRKN